MVEKNDTSQQDSDEILDEETTDVEDSEKDNTATDSSEDTDDVDDTEEDDELEADEEDDHPNQDKPSKDAIIKRAFKSRDKHKKENSKLKAELAKYKDSSDDGSDTELESNIEKVIQNKFGITLTEAKEVILQKKIDDLVDKYPEFEGLEKRFFKHKIHSNYKKVPLKKLGEMLLGKGALKRGAEMERDSTDKSRRTRMGGGKVQRTQDTATTKKDFMDKNPKEYKKWVENLQKKGL